MKTCLVGILSISLLAAPAQAAELSFEALPQQGASTVQWMGAPKMIQQRQHGVVSVAPRGLEQGRLAFDVEVRNLDDRAAIFGQDSVEVRTADQALALASPGRLATDAQKKATWSRIGIGVMMVALVGLAAAARGARGIGPTYFVTPPDPRRDPKEAASLSGAEQPVPQTTNIPSRYLYSGRIFVDRPKGNLKGREISMLVSFNGEQYPFAFRVSEGH